MSIKSELTKTASYLRSARKAIAGRGGEISATAGLKDLPTAIFNIPADSSLGFYSDNTVAYKKTTLANAKENILLNEIGGMTYKSNQLLPTGYWDIASKSGTYGGVTFTNHGDGTFTLNGTATKQTTFYLFNAYKGSGFVDAIKCVGTLYLGLGATLPDTVQCFVQTNNEYDEGGLGASFYGGSGSVVNVYSHLGAIDIIYLSIQSGTVFNNLTLKPMLSVGSTEQPYEPHFDGLRSSKVTALKVYGANLLNAKNIKNSSATVTILNEDGFRVDGFNVRYIIPSPKAGTYYISFGSTRTGSYGGGMVLATYNSKGSLIDSDAWYPDKLNGSYSQVCDGTEHELRIIFYGSGSSGGSSATYTNVMLSFNASVPYTRYHEPITIAIPEAVQALEGYGEGNPDNASEYNIVDFKNRIFIKKGDIFNREWVPLATPTTTDITAELGGFSSVISVEPSGQIEFENEYENAVPSTITYIVKAGG